MAGTAGLLDLEEKNIPVTIREPSLYLLGVAARSPFSQSFCRERLQ